MKLKYLFISILCVITLSSCSKKNKDIVIINEEDTIKKTITNKENEIFWTDAIDEEVLTTALSFPEIFENYNSLNINLVNSLSYSFSDCYPSIQNIGSLDHSEISSELNIFISRVCNAILSNPENSLCDFFDKEYLFNKTFFINDLKDIWKTKFNIEFSNKKLFDKYYIGDVKESFDLTEVKIRFYKNDNYIDITLFISQNEKRLNLKQIEINY